MNKNTILIIFGVSGDLANRYLLPAIREIKKANMLPEHFEIVGISRGKDPKYFTMDVTKLEEYERLDKHLEKISEKWNGATDRLYYLAVPPEASQNIIDLLGQSGLSKKEGTKILLEKPFGKDLASAAELVTHISKYFTSEQVYRVDHYLAKQTAQNIIVFREGNSLFKKTWNKDFIESIEIIASETIGIEGRAHFYEQTGALRDYVQNHLLELAALLLMDLPAKIEDVPKLREEALQNLNIICDIETSACVKRAQYEGYKEEVGNPKTRVETFVSLSLQSSDKRWQGVPIRLTTGKALSKRLTQIKIRYKKDKDFKENDEANDLVIRIQPDP
jgi:glucose-6-phosphate 1-dehydrogenase